MIIIANKILWAVATAFILIASIYFTKHLGFVQFRFRKMIHYLFSKPKNKKSISPFQTLMMSLGGRVGVGSIAGVALAIYLGGVGSLFWMWVTAFLAAALTFSETVLGIMYKEKDEGDIYKGGPAYYIKKGLGNPLLGGIYAILIIVCYTGGFVGIQANTITKSLCEMITIKPIFVGISLCLLTGLVIFGGIKKIAGATSKIVPLMALFYLGLSLYIALTNISSIPRIFSTIIKEAFQLKPFLTGFLSTFIIGIERGIFSNEAGLGTGSMASSTVDTDNTVSQGYVQMLGIYITTILFCTATAIIILTSPYDSLSLTDVNGIEITQFAFQYHLGGFGNIAIFISILLFSFSTVLTGYYYSESSLKYFFAQIKAKYLLILKIFTLIVLLIGALMSSESLWNLVDVMVAILAIINIWYYKSVRSKSINQD